MTVDVQRFAHCRTNLGVIHKRKVPFKPTVICPLDLRQKLRRIRQLDAELERHILSGDDYITLLNEAWAANFHASTSLEGNPLSKEEVRRTTRNLLDGYLPVALDPYYQEIVQHAFIWVRPEAFSGKWSVAEIKSLHTFLMEKHPEAKPGQLRSGYESTTITNVKGEEWFHTAPGRSVEEELGELVRWLNEEAAALDPVVAACLFFHEFESIHPFEDGNGRTGRVLFHLYLQNNGLDNSHKCLIEPLLTKDPTLYYNILGWTDDKGTYTELIDFFVECVLEGYEKAVRVFSNKDLLAAGVEENAKQLLIRAKQYEPGGWFKVKDAAEWVDGRSEQTVRKHLQMWVAKGALEAEGKTTAKRYRFRNPLQKIIKIKKEVETQPIISA